MIEPETALQAAHLLSTSIGEMVEDEHVDMLSRPGSVDEGLARALRLQALGGDLAVLAQAMTVLLTRCGEEVA